MSPSARALSLLLLLPLAGGCDFIGFGYPAADTADSGAWSDDGAALVDCSAAEAFGNQPDYPTAGRVYGQVASPSGQLPVAGAEVTVDDQDAWTLSADGGCFGMSLPPGEHRLKVTKGRYRAATTVTVRADGEADLGRLLLDAGDLGVVVIDGAYDEVGILLDRIGLEYEGAVTTEEVLGDLGALQRHDVVFAACGSRTSLDNLDDLSDLPYDGIRAWVEAGGTLYVSDWEYPIFAGVAPEALTFSPEPSQVLSGPSGTLTARVLSRNVVALLGSEEVDIAFDLPGWAIVSAPGAAEVVVEAEVAGATRPLAAIHRLGSGRIVYTSFHNEAQATQDMLAVLYELILAL